MLFQGDNVTVQLLSNGIAECTFAGQGSVNILNQQTLNEFKAALFEIEHCSEVKAVLLISAKSSFFVGADINEFLPTFALPLNELTTWIKEITDIFDCFEDMHVPTAAAIKGFALGGGCELALACDYRIADTSAQVGLPEVKLGIMPGFGGTVRLPRIIGADNAVELMSTGRSQTAKEAFLLGLIDAVIEPENLRDAAIHTLMQAIEGKLDWHKKRQIKLEPLRLNKTEALMVFSTCKAMISAKAGKHYPAPIVIVNTLESCATLERKQSMAIENHEFAKLAKTDEAIAQTGIFLADQVVKSNVKKAIAMSEKEVNSAAVIGAGIMGGGIAYQSAYKNIPIVMKDIQQSALDLGLATASNILTKLHDKARITLPKVLNTLNNITPSLHSDSLKKADIIVEAVIENPDVKSAVLSDIEQQVADDVILTSNTSTISIDLLAKNLVRKEKFCGMHFFNPVNKMPLVEVIRGNETSDQTIATVVAYAAKMGKSPIVVNDCPGFYVNRVLFPYLAGFSQLLLDGADFVDVDKIMEKEFGWPMGPAYLLDVVGIDTAEHCTSVMASGFPHRMAKIPNDAVTLLYQAGRLGQKNGGGFYNYSKDKRGKPHKEASEQAYQLIQSSQSVVFTDAEVIDRLMIPMINEVVRCLEEGIVNSAAEADMGLIYGIGFPPFRGGAIRYLETIGINEFIKRADKLASLGDVYQVTESMREMARLKKSYFSSNVNISLKEGV
jgi:3-hydroxyacyl-CoA dehydrogenase/enoyl-CoA hydratase/3-hydroxybutyryl-CoA epimerase/enoyl-CoA isomerase